MRIVGPAFLAFSLMIGSAVAQTYPIAGLTPNQRPDGAPTIKTFTPDAAQLERYHHGVTKPYPTTLGAKDQGAWFTPFNRPGMLAPYDLRGWHAAQAPK